MTKGLRSSPVPLYVQIEEDLRSRIRSGELRPLDQVSSELELAESFGVSRMTARKSLDRLVDEGLLFRRPGKGTFVSQGKIAHSASTRLSFSHAMHDLGFRVTTRVLDAGLIPGPAAIARALREPEGNELALVRRLRLVEGQPAAIHAAFLPQRLAGLLDQDLTGSLNDLITAAGARVLHARDTIEAVTASADEARLLKIAKGAPLVRIEGVGLSAGLEPLRYTEALYRGDRFRFRLGTDGDSRDLTVEVKLDEARSLAT
jgi:GntR family transcriptional regulator